MKRGGVIVQTRVEGGPEVVGVRYEDVCAPLGEEAIQDPRLAQSREDITVPRGVPAHQQSSVIAQDISTNQFSGPSVGEVGRGSMVSRRIRGNWDWLNWITRRLLNFATVRSASAWVLKEFIKTRGTSAPVRLFSFWIGIGIS